MKFLTFIIGIVLYVKTLTGCAPAYGPVETGDAVIKSSLKADGKFGTIIVDYIDVKTRKITLNGVSFIVDNLKKLSLSTTAESKVPLRLSTGEMVTSYSYKESNLVFGIALLDKTRDGRIETLEEIMSRNIKDGFVDVGEGKLLRVKYYSHVNRIAITVLSFTENYR